MFDFTESAEAFPIDCNQIHEFWPGTNVLDMHACRCKCNKHDCWLGATVKNKTADNQSYQSHLMLNADAINIQIILTG